MPQQLFLLAKLTVLALDGDFEVSSSEENRGALSGSDLDKNYEPDEAPGGAVCVHKHHLESAKERT